MYTRLSLCPPPAIQVRELEDEANPAHEVEHTIISDVRYTYRYRQVHVHVSTDHITHSRTLSPVALSLC